MMINSIDSPNSPDSPTCRFCHEVTSEFPGDALIQPWYTTSLTHSMYNSFSLSLCNGSIQFVHRSCLDTWRTVSQKPESFYQCDTCNFGYHFQEQLPYVPNFTQRLIVGLKIALDILLVIIPVLMLMVIIGFGVDLLQLVKLERQAGVPERFTSYLVAHKFLRVSMEGVLGFFFFLGVAVILHVICSSMFKCCDDLWSSEPVCASNYPYYGTQPIFIWWWFPYWYTPSTFYSPGCSGCVGNVRMNSQAAAILALIIIGLIVLLGFIIGIILLVAFLHMLVTRHASVLKRRHLCSQSTVLDLNSLSEEDRNALLMASPELPVAGTIQESTPLVTPKLKSFEV